MDIIAATSLFPSLSLLSGLAAFLFLSTFLLNTRTYKDTNMNMNPGWRLPRPFSQLAVLRRCNQDIFPRRFSLIPKTSRHRRIRRVSPSTQSFQCFHAMADSSYLPIEDIYHPEVDVEYFEDYVPGGYHPTLIGDTYCSGRYTVVHKLGFGGYSTIWLAWDQQRQRYVSLKILTARASPDSHEGMSSNT